MKALEVPATFVYIWYIHASRWVAAHVADIARALAAAAAAAAAAVFLYYFYAAWTDRRAACDAAGSAFCTRHEPDPYLAADRRRTCDWRAYVCTQWTFGMAARQIGADAWAGSRDFFVGVADVLWPVAAVLLLLHVILRFLGLK